MPPCVLWQFDTDDQNSFKLCCGQIIELDSGDVVKAAGPAVHDPHGRDTDELLVVPQVCVQTA